MNIHEILFIYSDWKEPSLNNPRLFSVPFIPELIAIRFTVLPYDTLLKRNRKMRRFSNRKIIAAKKEPLFEMMLTWKRFFGFFVQIWNADAGREHCIVSMFSGHCGCCFCRQCIKLLRCHASVKTIYHLQCDWDLNKTNSVEKFPLKPYEMWQTMTRNAHESLKKMN